MNVPPSYHFLFRDVTKSTSIVDMKSHFLIQALSTDFVARCVHMENHPELRSTSQF